MSPTHLTWPDLPDACPEWNVETGRPCILGNRHPVHRDLTGHQWPLPSLWELHDDPEFGPELGPEFAPGEDPAARG